MERGKRMAVQHWFRYYLGYITVWGLTWLGKPQNVEKARSKQILLFFPEKGLLIFQWVSEWHMKFLWDLLHTPKVIPQMWQTKIAGLFLWWNIWDFPRKSKWVSVKEVKYVKEFLYISTSRFDNTPLVAGTAREGRKGKKVEEDKEPLILSHHTNFRWIMGG